MPRPEIQTPNLAKSCNEALILASLGEGAKHGYQLALDIEERSDGLFRFHHGTLYPILHKLEKDGLISGQWSNEDGGRKRKSYRLTPPGERYADEQLQSWRRFRDAFEAATGQTGKEDR